MTTPLNASPVRQKRATTSYLNAIKPILLVLSLLFLSAIAAVAQPKSSYNLLWRISGKGLTKPSYLFGTMHVKDKRAFGFSDSVMLAMQNCQAFALETHPDTIVKKMFLTMHGQDSLRSVRRLLSKDDYDKLAGRFQKKNGYPMGDIDPIQAEAMLQPERAKPDDKKTFVDAYLFGVARSMSKNTYGLEDGAGQFDDYFGANSPQLKSRITEMLEDDDEEGQLDDLDELITAYSTGNLTNIIDLLTDDKLNDSILIARNNVMVKSMLMYMASQPLFTAVGVAHLPGDNGIIALLRHEGYTLTQVDATFTGVANKFNTDYTKLKWQTFTDENRGYSMDLPFAPIQTDVLLGMNTVIYPDIANDISFGSYAILEGSATKPLSEKVVLGAMLKRLKLARTNRIMINKVVVLNGLKATDLTVSTGEGTGLRYRIFFNNNMMYCLYAGNTLANLNQPYANRFFNSFKAFTPIVQHSKGWITLKNDTAAFEVKLPGKPQSIEKMVPVQAGQRNATLKLYMSIDSVKFENYLVRYNDYPTGMFLSSPEKAFEAITAELKTKEVKITSIKNIVKDDNEGLEIDFTLKGYNCRAQLYTRGNRVYMLLKQNLSPGAPITTDDDFFTSFKFTPYLVPTLHPYDIANGNFKSKIFDDLKIVKDSVADYKSFFYSDGTVYSVNRTSGALYGIEHANISKYYRAKNADSIYSSLIPEFVSYADTLIKVDTIKVNGITGREFITRVKKGTQKHRFRVFIDNGDIFYFNGHQSSQEMHGDIENAFYNSLVKTHDNAPIDLASSKARLITNDLEAADSLTRVQAKGALSFYKFQKDELPYLYAAIKKPMSDDSTSYGSRGKLVRVLSKVNDGTTTAQLKQLYLTPGTPKELKSTILSVITEADKKSGYDTYLDLLTNYDAPDLDNMYTAISPLTDSLEYVTANFDKILPLLKNPRYRKNVLNVFNNMLYSDNKGKYTEFIKTHFDDLTTYANEDLNAYFAQQDSIRNKWSSPVSYYLEFMKNVQGKAITAPFTAKLLKDDAVEDNLSDAIIARLKNNLPVQQPVINKILDSVYYRYSFLKELNEIKQLSRAPLKYRTQAGFAKLSLTEFIEGSDTGSPANVVLLGTLPEKGNTYYVFKFAVPDYEEDVTYLGICGPYKTGSNVLDFKSYRVYTTWEAKETNWQKQAKKMIPELKKSIAEDLKD
ncbi:TraB/GumN family protein [Mucilaginibacter sp.]|uniref:TraB/GumN family protein n=1 Tax=Mucilaginibacter sp. TaxID=1882438 RepID=UPI0032678827